MGGLRVVGGTGGLADVGGTGTTVAGGGGGLAVGVVVTGQTVVLTGTMTVVTRVLCAGHEGTAGGQLVTVRIVVE